MFISIYPAILRDQLLKERGWEFLSEGKRREDLIRMDKFISGALERKKNAQSFQVLITPVRN